jgi:hypothetical protein
LTTLQPLAPWSGTVGTHGFTTTDLASVRVGVTEKRLLPTTAAVLMMAGGPSSATGSFRAHFPSYFEVDEDFGSTHNLAEDKRRGVLLDFDASGREIEVVRLKENQVEARLKYLRQFQAGTGLHLGVFIDSRRF